MSLLARASKLLKANIHHMLDSAEDPEVMVKELMRDMQASMADLRRETVNAVARERLLEKKVAEARERVDDLETKAGLALDHEDEALARRLLGDKVEAERLHTQLESELDEAKRQARRVREDLRRMQQQVDTARRKQDELIRRKRAAEARISTQNASGAVAGADNGASFDGYADAIEQIEARAEAGRELADAETADDRKVEELTRTVAIDEELARLREKRAAKS